MAISIADSSSSSPRSSLAFLLDPEKVELPRPKQSMWHRLGLRRWLGRDDRDFPSRSSASSDTSSASNNRPRDTDSHPPPKFSDNITRRLSRRVGVGLPRSTTFKRQHSERRDRLSPVDSEPRRAASADRRTLSLQRTKSPQSVVDPRLSAPEINWPREDLDPDPAPTKVDEPPETNEIEEFPQDNNVVRSEWDHHYPEVTTDAPEGYPVDTFDMELERRWILNLSMHFRDRSEREKFFVTYAEAANRWRRVTISCDYRDAEPESLEQDLKELRYQRDKCARIYESIRESLPDIQFYDTVTNLKLETRDGRLHVHVTEDVNEIIPYPPISSIGHLPEAELVPERRLHFEAHLSGFVYNVRLGDRSFIKKEIPGPDTVDEFLYEINALHALKGTPNVIQVEGIVVDDRQEVVKGLLISFAEKGALVDLLYEYRGAISWERRERWAKQIVHGLCEIHESGYVQGDFTLSNIVVDANDDAKIIDINRRGCPVGWEPPEIAAKIESNQRISMYIGVKTDLFQLGMTLWALAMEEDEPERQPRPFLIDDDMLVPDYYKRLVSICLSPIPRHRLSAKELLNFFPPETGNFDQPPRMHPPSMGVGLHNGALPLYDSRAAFLYPRGRQMNNFGHNMQTPPQPLIDSFESIPSPETDGAADREEQERRMGFYGLAPQPNGIRKKDSMSFDAQSSVDDLVSVNPPLDYEEREVDSNGVDPLHRPPSTGIAFNSSLNSQTLPDEPVGAGSWKASSRSSSIHYVHPETPAMAQDPVDIYPASSAAEDWPEQEQLQPVSTLLQSALPINPATETPGQEKPTASDNVSPTNVTSGHPQTIIDLGPSLSESNLLINPAAKSPATKSENAPKSPADTQSAFEQTGDSFQDAYLSKSLLPINPAVKLPEANILESDAVIQLNCAEASPEYRQQILQDESLNLCESRLPINPATEPGTSALLKDSLLPPDTQTSDVQSPSQYMIPDRNQMSFLLNSQLPINPAASCDQTSNYEIPTRPTPSVQPTNYPSQTIVSSNLPMDLAVQSFSNESLNKTMDAISAIETQPALYTSHNGFHDRTSCLNDSHLPINPAFTDKALQYNMHGLR
ncbi:hypothetical protein BDV18DRAFT_152000 [Aspergillus unguis]